jgi:hypothetical protein
MLRDAWGSDDDAQLVLFAGLLARLPVWPKTWTLRVQLNEGSVLMVPDGDRAATCLTVNPREPGDPDLGPPPVNAGEALLLAVGRCLGKIGTFHGSPSLLRPMMAARLCGDSRGELSLSFTGDCLRRRRGTSGFRRATRRSIVPEENSSSRAMSCRSGSAASI